jgi:hypothetical protein
MHSGSTLTTTFERQVWEVRVGCTLRLRTRSVPAVTEEQRLWRSNRNTCSKAARLLMEPVCERQIPTLQIHRSYNNSLEENGWHPMGMKKSKPSMRCRWPENAYVDGCSCHVLGATLPGRTCNHKAHPIGIKDSAHEC